MRSWRALLLVTGLAALPLTAAAQTTPAGPGLEDWLPRLRKGTWVKVEGDLLPGGGLKATEIKVRHGDIDESQVTTTIVGVDANHKVFTTRIGVQVVTNNRTELQASKSSRASLSTLQAGDRVEAEGKLQKNGSLLADEVEIKKPQKPGRESGDDEITGRIESVDVAARKIVLLGISVYFDENTKNKTPFLE